MNPNFANMTTPALVVAGDKDDSPLSVRGPEWLADPYFLSPGDKSLLTLFGAEHSLGGIAGYEVQETTDEHPERVALIQRVTWAYLRHALGIEDAELDGSAEGSVGERRSHRKDRVEVLRGARPRRGAWCQGRPVRYPPMVVKYSVAGSSRPSSARTRVMARPCCRRYGHPPRRRSPLRRPRGRRRGRAFPP